MPILVAQRFTSVCIPERHTEHMQEEGFLTNSGEKQTLYICLSVAHEPILLMWA